MAEHNHDELRRLLTLPNAALDQTNPDQTRWINNFRDKMSACIATTPP